MGAVLRDRTAENAIFGGGETLRPLSAPLAAHEAPVGTATRSGKLSLNSKPSSCAPQASVRVTSPKKALFAWECRSVSLSVLQPHDDADEESAVRMTAIRKGDNRERWTVVVASTSTGRNDAWQPVVE